jgi:hypothetical protein
LVSLALLAILAVILIVSYPSFSWPVSGGESTSTNSAANAAADDVTDALDPADAARAGFSIEPLEDVGGLIDEDTARTMVLEIYRPPDPSVKLDLFLGRVTVSATIGGDRPVQDLPVWVARYSNLRVTTPGGHLVDTMYKLHDAKTGEFLVGLIGK